MLLKGLEPTTQLLQKVLRLKFFNSIHWLDLDGMTDLGPKAESPL